MFPESETSTYFSFQVNVEHTVSVKNNEIILHSVCGCVFILIWRMHSLINWKLETCVLFATNGLWDTTLLSQQGSDIVDRCFLFRNVKPLSSSSVFCLLPN